MDGRDQCGAVVTATAAAAALDDEEVAWLSCPCPLYTFSAVRAKGADRYAAAFSTRPLLMFLYLADSDLTDAGLAQLQSLRGRELRPRKVKMQIDAVACTGPTFPVLTFVFCILTFAGYPHQTSHHELF